MYGPVQFSAVAFEDLEDASDILQELDFVREVGIIRLIDFLFITKDKNGDVEALEATDLTEEEQIKFGAVIGGLIGCPFLMRNPSEQFLKNLIKKYNIPNQQKKEFAAALNTVPVIPEKRVKLASELLFSLADFFSIPDLGFLNARRQLHREQAQVAEEIRAPGSAWEKSQWYRR